MSVMIDAIARDDSVEPSMESSACRRCKDKSDAEDSVADEKWKLVDAAKEIEVRVECRAKICN